MELEQIDVIRTQTAQALLNMGQHRLFILAAALGGDHHILAHVMQGLAQLLLTVCIGVGGIKIVDPGLIGRRTRAQASAWEMRWIGSAPNAVRETIRSVRPNLIFSISTPSARRLRGGAG